MINSRSFHYKDLLTLLEGSVKDAEEEVILVAPFIKHSIIEILLKHLKEKTKLTVYTRWRLDEILSGVSDIEIWELIRNKQYSTLKLSPNLHAKYYRFDDTIIIGSANLTVKALMGKQGANLELLQSSIISNQSYSFEIALANHSVEVNDELFDQTRRIVDQHEDRELVTEVNELGISYNEDDLTIEDGLGLKEWIPKSRNPENLYTYYSKNENLLSEMQKQNAKNDLAYFPIPKELNKEGFDECISFYLLQMPIVQNLNTLLSKPRRFGEVRDMLKTVNPNIDATRSLQTLIRWLQFYSNDKYTFEKANFSEIIRLKC